MKQGVDHSVGYESGTKPLWITQMRDTNFGPFSFPQLGLLFLMLDRLSNYQFAFKEVMTTTKSLDFHLFLDSSIQFFNPFLSCRHDHIHPGKFIHFRSQNGFILFIRPE